MLSTKSSIMDNFQSEYHSDTEIAGVSIAMIAVAIILMTLVL